VLHFSRRLLANISTHFETVFSSGFAESGSDDETSAVQTEPDDRYDSDSEQDQVYLARHAASRHSDSKPSVDDVKTPAAGKTDIAHPSLNSLTRADQHASLQCAPYA
jgi:hypothetical protein